MPENRPLEVLRKEEVKLALKEAIKEWMEDKYAEIGKWAVRSIVVAGLSALAYFIVHFNKW